MNNYPPCRKCGAAHGMGLEDKETGIIEPLDICRDCMCIGTIIPPKQKIKLSTTTTKKSNGLTTLYTKTKEIGQTILLRF